jgi:hypothetical protein
MSMLKTLVMVAPLALSTAAFAQPSRLSDAQYIAAARCQVLMSSRSLGAQDSQAIDVMMKSEGASRSVFASQRAEDAADSARQAVSHAGAYGKAALIAERDGPCRALTGVATMSASATPAGTTRAN